MKGKHIMTLNLKQLRDVFERSIATFFHLVKYATKKCFLNDGKINVFHRIF